jgi:hypothetical protein
MPMAGFAISAGFGSDPDGATIDLDTVVPEVVLLLAPGEILAHPFTTNTAAFVSHEGRVHQLFFEAVIQRALGCTARGCYRRGRVRWNSHGSALPDPLGRLRGPA